MRYAEHAETQSTQRGKQGRSKGGSTERCFILPSSDLPSFFLCVLCVTHLNQDAPPARPAPHPRTAASIFATSIFFIVIIASNALFAAARSGLVNAFVSATGVICQFTPHLSLHQPHWLSSPPLPTMAFQ